jgi:capsular polysaccharide biosynthesis protein
LLGIPANRIIWIGDEIVETEELYFLSYFHFGEAPNKLNFFLKQLADCVPTGPPPIEARRILISRPDSFARRLLNERQIVAALDSFEFEVFAPGLYSLADQINMFRNADIAIGPHGAGLMNFGFCKPETIALELFSEYTVQPAFWSVSSACGLRYGFVVGSSFDQDCALSRHDGSWEAPFIINPYDVVEALERLGVRDSR